MEVSQLKHSPNEFNGFSLRIIVIGIILFSFTGCGPNVQQTKPGHNEKSQQENAKLTSARGTPNTSLDTSKAISVSVKVLRTNKTIEIADDSLRDILNCFEQGHPIAADTPRLGYAEYSIKIQMASGTVTSVFLGGSSWESSDKLSGYLKEGWRQRFKSLFDNFSPPSVIFHGTTSNVAGEPFFTFCFTNSLPYSIQCDSEDPNSWGPPCHISELNSNVWSNISQRQFCCGRFPHKIEPGKSVLFRVYPRTDVVWRAGIEYYVGTNYHTATIKNVVWSSPITGNIRPNSSTSGSK